MEEGDVMTIEEILAGESQNVEFKVERLKDYRKYMKTVIAFANGKGGRLIFGVEDRIRPGVWWESLKRRCFRRWMPLPTPFPIAVSRLLFRISIYRQ